MRITSRSPVIPPPEPSATLLFAATGDGPRVQAQRILDRFEHAVDNFPETFVVGGVVRPVPHIRALERAIGEFGVTLWDLQLTPGSLYGQVIQRVRRAIH